MSISTTQQRVGFGATGAIVGIVLGVQVGAVADRGAAGIVVGAALGAAAGFGVGFGIGTFGTMHNPNGNRYNYHAEHADMVFPGGAIAAGSVAAAGSGIAFLALGKHPSTRMVANTAVAILGASMLTAALAGAFCHVVPDAPKPAPTPDVSTPQPLPGHGS